MNGEMRFYYNLLECKISIVVADGRYKDCKTKFHLRTKDDEMLKEIDHGFLKVAKEVEIERFGLLPNYINYILMIMMCLMTAEPLLRNFLIILMGI